MDSSNDAKPSEPDVPKAGSSKLDVFSEDFDPLAAIYSSDLAIPAPAAPVLDNVEAFVSKVVVPTSNKFLLLFDLEPSSCEKLVLKSGLEVLSALQRY